MTKDMRNNLFTFLCLLSVAIIGIYYGIEISSNYKYLRIWGLDNVLLLLIAIPFLLFQEKAKIPNFWQREISSKKRFLIPIAIGIIFGILDVIVFKLILHPEPYTELPPFVQPFPYSIFLYLSGALELEVFYRLIPLTLILLLGTWYKSAKHYWIFFWIGAILTALREPLEQLPESSLSIIIYSFLTGFFMNLLQAFYFRKAGFLATLSLRLGHYLIWHILLGIFIQYFELI